MNLFTRREKIFLLAFGVLFVSMILFPALLSAIGEFGYLLLIVVPLGFMLATDKERLARLKKD